MYGKLARVDRRWGHLQRRREKRFLCGKYADFVYFEIYRSRERHITHSNKRHVNKGEV